MTTKGLGLAASVALVACDGAEAPANNQAAAAPKAAEASAEGDLGAAERLVRERLRNPQGLAFADPVRSASEGVTIVCGRYSLGGERQRYIVVDATDVFLEPELQPGEMERYYGEFCGEGTGNRPSPVASQGNAQ